MDTHEVEIAKIKAYLEEIRQDIKELKEENRNVHSALMRMSGIEDRLRGNDETHRLMWNNIHLLENKLVEGSYVTKEDLRVFGVVISVIFAAINLVFVSIWKL